MSALRDIENIWITKALSSDAPELASLRWYEQWNGESSELGLFASPLLDRLIELEQNLEDLEEIGAADASLTLLLWGLCRLLPVMKDNTRSIVQNEFDAILLMHYFGEPVAVGAKPVHVQLVADAERGLEQTRSAVLAVQEFIDQIIANFILVHYEELQANIAAVDKTIQAKEAEVEAVDDADQELVNINAEGVQSSSKRSHYLFENSADRIKQKAELEFLMKRKKIMLAMMGLTSESQETASAVKESVRPLLGQRTVPDLNPALKIA